MKQTLKNNSKITWKLYEVSITAPEGVLLKGEIHYSVKDYSVCLTEPINKNGCGGHLLYAVPAVYATDEPNRDGVHMFRLIDLAKENLLALYRGDVKKCSL